MTTVSQIVLPVEQMTIKAEEYARHIVGRAHPDDRQIIADYGQHIAENKPIPPGDWDKFVSAFYRGLRRSDYLQTACKLRMLPMEVQTRFENAIALAVYLSTSGAKAGAA